ncbi:MAG TPA: TadG family pilus assembly protein [Trinickia sp.]|uniref:TadG family pilus assembly protein n=1 Tax=Trinickia sp. TaxID=2571163 RepID=UPI002CEC02D7|nr:TadG family pilus assembly protein [Trinickia sp.]HVW51114.1 TadG family pilus assembly protein [Trinickia sp.]
MATSTAKLRESTARAVPVRPPRRAHSHRFRQRGAIAPIVALFMTIVVAALGALDVGNAFFARRSLQRTADLAALAAAQTMDDACTQPLATARANAAANGFDPDATGQTLALVCGRWDTQANAAPSYFAAGTVDAPLNAVQVTVQRKVPYFFLGPARQMSATATAKSTNLGAFTVGTALAQLQTGLVNSLLNALLGANLSLSVASYESLANARVRMRDVMAAAGVGTIDQLLSMQVDAAQLAELMLSALSSTAIADANLQTDIATLQAIAHGGISNTARFALGSGAGGNGVFALDLADRQSALDATVSPLDALLVAAEIAKAGQPPIQLAAGLTIGGLGAALKVQIIEPPVLAVGEAGMDPATQQWRTQAHTAQVRLYLNVALGTPMLPVIGNIGMNLPLSLEAAPGTAWLQSTQCAPTKTASASTIGVQPGLAKVCLGDAPANLSASQPFSCATPATLIDVPNVVKVTANVALPAVVPQSSAATLSFDGVTPNDDDYQSANANAVGSVLANALSGVAASLAQPSGLDVTLLGGLSLPLGLLDSVLLAALLRALDGLLSGIDLAIDPLLQLLGVQVGVATIHDLSLTCGAAQLVY